MKKLIMCCILFCFIGCDADRGNTISETEAEIRFDKNKWETKEGHQYPYRALMLNDIVYNDTIRSLTKSELIELLGAPDRINEGHLYYLIAQKRLGSWPLHTRTMVIKLYDDDKVEWIKIHE